MMLERVRVEKISEGWDDRTTYRVCEADGTPSVNWLPGYENDDPLGPLDRGGFDRLDDATAFALGVDYERAFCGLLDGVTVADIERERRRLDKYFGKPAESADGFAGARKEKPAPVVTHRRRVA